MRDGVSDGERRLFFEVAAAKDAMLFGHTRRGLNSDIAPLMEALNMATDTGAKMHKCHINTNAMGNTGAWFRRLMQELRRVCMSPQW